MYLESVKNISQAAKLKVEYLKRSTFAYMVASILAGTYIGIGIVLIFAVGAPLAAADSVFIKTLMGISFGIALILVVFAGAELFTGNNMFMAIGLLKKEVTAGELLRVWGFSFLGWESYWFAHAGLFSGKFPSIIWRHLFYREGFHCKDEYACLAVISAGDIMQLVGMPGALDIKPD